MKHYISNDVLDISKIYELITFNAKLELSDEAKLNIKKSYEYLHHKIETENSPIYGINTGFGSLGNVSISKEDIQKLQENLIKSHACGIGERIPDEVVKVMLFLKIQSLSYGYSGVQLSTVERLIDFYNEDVLPVVYSLGSLGTSGDLAPLAHLSLPLLGEGEVRINGKVYAGAELEEKYGWKPVKLQAKEGWALLSGTQFMSAFGVINLLRAYRLSYYADFIGTMSLEAFDGRKEPFEKEIHIIRPHKGQIKTAERISHFLEGSQLIEQSKKNEQDPYSFRCMPQVHGATKDTISFVHQTVKTEINSVTDNPNIFSDEDKIISGGNFHGQPLALASDYLGIAMAELGNISERRIFQLVSGLRGLPHFLVNHSGLNSGFMIPQYTAAVIASQNRQLAPPASIDNIVSSNGQQDHMSMGANSATKCYKILDNLERILAIELMNASQALAFRKPLKSAAVIEEFLADYRKKVPFVEDDRMFYKDMELSLQFMRKWEWNREDIFS